MASILVIDDERSMREFLEILLKQQGHQVATEQDAGRALERIKEDAFDLVITDLRLGAGSGMDILQSVKSLRPTTEVVVVTAFATTENAIQAMKLGAHDYVLKPFKVDELKLVVEKALEHQALLQENRLLRRRVASDRVLTDGIIGRSAAMQDVRQLVEKVAKAKTTVLITGESGTGKEVVARAVHQKGDRGDQPFVAINCGAIPEGLIESELFGHEKGSFTGAVETKAGLFEVAGSGTLFLDEVGELPLPVQVKLLRVLQERRLRRVGGSVDIGVPARILAATHRDLSQEVKAGRFREDLFYRLNVIQIPLVPLRQRREDIPLFLETFLQRFAVDLGRPPARFTPEAERLLLAYDYPGNIRELENIVERAVTLADGESIGPGALPHGLRGGDAQPPAAVSTSLPEGGMDLQAHLDAIERRVLEQALERTGGVKTDAARLLSLTFRSLRYRLAKFGIGH
jgi:two-component system response regulator PilR (NtrC family)